MTKASLADPVPGPDAGGFTLFEVLLASAVLAFVMAAIVQAIVSGQDHTYDALHARRANALVESLVEEVISRPYTDPDGDTALGPDAGEAARDAFDAVDDFHGYTENPGGIADATGAAYPDAYQGFTRTVAIENTTLTASPLGGDLTGLTVTVTVTEGGNGRSWNVSRFVPEPSS